MFFQHKIYMFVKSYTRVKSKCDTNYTYNKKTNKCILDKKIINEYYKEEIYKLHEMNKISKKQNKIKIKELYDGLQPIKNINLLNYQKKIYNPYKSNYIEINQPYSDYDFEPSSCQYYIFVNAKPSPYWINFDKTDKICIDVYGNAFYFSDGIRIYTFVYIEEKTKKEKEKIKENMFEREINELKNQIQNYPLGMDKQGFYYDRYGLRFIITPNNKKYYIE
jgi:hypothetical protein